MENNGAQWASLFICLTCISPAILGGLFGAWMQRRRLTAGSWGQAFIPGFVRKWLERYQ
jgi:hypothetical protein